MPIDRKTFTDRELLLELADRMGVDFNSLLMQGGLDADEKGLQKEEEEKEVDHKSGLQIDWDKFGDVITKSKSNPPPLGRVFERKEQEALQDLWESFLSYIELPGSENFKPSKRIELWAYGVATARLEVGPNFKPVREGFKSTDEEAEKEMKRRRARYLATGKGPKYLYAEDIREGGMAFGRGMIQVTWWENVLRLKAAMERDLGIKLEQDPAKDLSVLLAYPLTGWVLWYGLQSGFFNGRRRGLFYYLDEMGGWKGAVESRRTVNVLNRAELVASWYYDVLTASKEAITYG